MIMVCNMNMEGTAESEIVSQEMNVYFNTET